MNNNSFVKSSQKMRVIVNGVGLFGTKKTFTETLFATARHREAFEIALSVMGSSNGIGLTVWAGTSDAVDIQIDKL